MNNSDCIIMKNMSFYGFHGVLEEEKQMGQKFYLDVILKLNLQPAGKSDNIDQTVSYALAYDVIKFQCEENKYQLIESLAENISNDLFSTFDRIEEVEIEVRKPAAPVRGNFDYMAVKINRIRENQ